MKEIIENKHRKNTNKRKIKCQKKHEKPIHKQNANHQTPTHPHFPKKTQKSNNSRQKQFQNWVPNR